MNAIERYLISKGLGTFRGWILRKANTAALTASSAITGMLMTRWEQTEQLASLNGISADTLATLHQQGVGLIQLLAGFVATLILSATEILLSRAAAKVKEVPINPVAIPAN
jgi:hypothetical protein